MPSLHGGVISAPHARISLATGRQGAGKTWRLSTLARALAPGRTVIVLDVSCEWPYGSMRAEPYALAGGATGAAELIDAGHRLVVVRPPLEPSPRPTAAAASDLATLACMVPGEAVLVLPEAHLAAREGWPLPAGLVHVVHRSRHVRVIVLADTQHPARLSTALRDDARWYVHATTSPRDIRRIVETVRDTVGPEHVPETLAALRTLDRRPPGWHIVLDGARSDLVPRR